MQPYIFSLFIIIGPPLAEDDKFMVYVLGRREGKPLFGDPNAPPELILWYRGLYPESCTNYAFRDTESMQLWIDCISFYDSMGGRYLQAEREGCLKGNPKLEDSIMDDALAAIQHLERRLGAEWVPLDLRDFRNSYLQQHVRGYVASYTTSLKPPQPPPGNGSSGLSTTNP